MLDSLGQYISWRWPDSLGSTGSSNIASGYIGAAEQPQPDHTRSLSDRQDSASQGQPETAQSMQADLAPGSSTGPEGPPSVSKGGRPGGSRVTPKAGGSTPKRQMNFWQEEEKAQFLNAYKVSISSLILLT